MTAIKIIKDDSHVVKRYVTGDTGVLVKRVPSRIKPYLIKLDKNPYLGNLRLSSLVYLDKTEFTTNDKT